MVARLDFGAAGIEARRIFAVERGIRILNIDKKLRHPDLALGSVVNAAANDDGRFVLRDGPPILYALKNQRLNGNRHADGPVEWRKPGQRVGRDIPEGKKPYQKPGSRA